ncbi:transcriptional regulator, TetR family [Micrococcales bacterium KH10]|nr:transcriptional regulator, TetR family [Micrococcales bacterium KH10]
MAQDSVANHAPRDSSDPEQLVAELTAHEHDAVTRNDEAMRRLRMLWDPPPPAVRGRKARLSLEDVITAATQIAQQHGLEYLSMRRLATELGVSPMSVYTYVPGRTELIDLMIDRAYSELTLPATSGDWRAGLGHYAREHFELYLRHPWILETNLWRAPLAPHVLDAQEAGLRALVDTALTAPDIVQILQLVDLSVQGLARAAIAETRDQEQSGMGEDQYWESLSSFWEDYFSVERYPTMTRIYLDGGFEEGASDSGRAIERLLDTIELTIDHAVGTGTGTDHDDCNDAPTNR